MGESINTVKVRLLFHLLSASTVWTNNHRSHWLQKITNKFPTFFGIWKYSTVFVIIRHCSLSWARWIQFTFSHRFSFGLILILLSHLCLSYPCGLFPVRLDFSIYFNLPICANSPTYMNVLDFVNSIHHEAPDYVILSSFVISSLRGTKYVFGMFRLYSRHECQTSCSSDPALKCEWLRMSFILA